nr:probable aminotransferase ACS12 isoform X2 [Malus domestica]
MRLIVPLQGVVQGRGGLILASLIPCALYYCLQLYLKRRRPSNPDPPSPSQSSSNLAELPRTPSRSSLSTRGPMGRVRMSSRASWVAKPNDSPYYIGLDRASEEPYDRVDNPDGVIQLGLSENRLCLDLIEKWVSENLMESMVGTDGGDLSISGIAAYQPFDGMTKLKVGRNGKV